MSQDNLEIVRGKIVGVDEFTERGEALEAAGLEE
jgi:hypothetical protein